MVDKKQELKKLKDAIIKTLRDNDELASLMADLKDRGVVDSATLLNLCVKIDDVLEITCATVSQNDLGKKKRGKAASAANKKITPRVGENAREVIDGRSLSSNEIAFQEWVNKRFDEDVWLRKFGLIW